MAIQNLQQLIEARQRQMGGRMIDGPVENPVDHNDEIVEIMKMLFDYTRQQFGQINNDINIIKKQQQEILNKFEDKLNN